MRRYHQLKDKKNIALNRTIMSFCEKATCEKINKIEKSSSIQSGILRRNDMKICMMNMIIGRT